MSTHVFTFLFINLRFPKRLNVSQEVQNDPPKIKPA